MKTVEQNLQEMTDIKRAMYEEALAADAEWSRLLHLEFGKNAGDMRYQKAGKGEEGSVLRAAHDAFVSKTAAWQRVMKHSASVSLCNCGQCKYCAIR